MEQTLCPIGRVVKPHGVRGKVKVEYFGGDPDRFTLYQEIFIRDNSGRPESFKVLEVTPQPPRLILRLKGIERIDETEGLIGKEILVRREDLPKLEEGEYYWFEILGMAVETERGRRIGTVKRIVPTGANDVYIVTGKRGEIFLPAIDQVIQKVDCKRRVIQVGRMEGLWEEEDEI
ncbi:MAG: 16S rRNA processing protein RimM [Deltaproteobacteria bacterium]|nr:16S rRNA processing protein RimM [Deltaproteobacteria bacterium]